MYIEGGDFLFLLCFAGFLLTLVIAPYVTLFSLGFWAGKKVGRGEMYQEMVRIKQARNDQTRN